MAVTKTAKRAWREAHDEPTSGDRKELLGYYARDYAEGRLDDDGLFDKLDSNKELVEFALIFGGGSGSGGEERDREMEECREHAEALEKENKLLFERIGELEGALESAASDDPETRDDEGDSEDGDTEESEDSVASSGGSEDSDEGDDEVDFFGGDDEDSGSDQENDEPENDEPENDEPDDDESEEDSGGGSGVDVASMVPDDDDEEEELFDIDEVFGEQ
jgi:hypothetical protein